MFLEWPGDCHATLHRRTPTAGPPPQGALVATTRIKGEKAASPNAFRDRKPEPCLACPGQAASPGAGRSRAAAPPPRGPLLRSHVPPPRQAPSQKSSTSQTRPTFALLHQQRRPSVRPRGAPPIAQVQGMTRAWRGGARPALARSLGLPGAQNQSRCSSESGSRGRARAQGSAGSVRGGGRRSPEDPGEPPDAAKLSPGALGPTDLPRNLRAWRGLLQALQGPAASWMVPWWEPWELGASGGSPFDQPRSVG